MSFRAVWRCYRPLGLQAQVCFSSSGHRRVAEIRLPLVKFGTHVDVDKAVRCEGFPFVVVVVREQPRRLCSVHWSRSFAFQINGLKEIAIRGFCLANPGESWRQETERREISAIWLLVPGQLRGISDKRGTSDLFLMTVITCHQKPHKSPFNEVVWIGSQSPAQSGIWLGWLLTLQFVILTASSFTPYMCYLIANSKKLLSKKFSECINKQITDWLNPAGLQSEQSIDCFVSEHLCCNTHTLPSKAD